MENVMVWAAYLGGWLLVAGSLLQARLARTMRGWLVVAAGAFCLATNQTWELAHHQAWTPGAFGALAVVGTCAAVGLAAGVGRPERGERGRPDERIGRAGRRAAADRAPAVANGGAPGTRARRASRTVRVAHPPRGTRARGQRIASSEPVGTHAARPASGSTATGAVPSRPVRTRPVPTRPEAHPHRGGTAAPRPGRRRSDG